MLQSIMASEKLRQNRTTYILYHGLPPRYPAPTIALAWKLNHEVNESLLKSLSTWSGLNSAENVNPFRT